MTTGMTTGMTTANLSKARRLHAALREFFIHHEGRESDLRALGRVLVLCQSASETVDDDYCRDKLRLVGEYAAELLSRGEHSRWGRDAASGAEFLRQQVLNALELYGSRLYSLETLHASQKRTAAPQSSALA